MSRLPALEVTTGQRAELERRLRAHTTTQRGLRRAKIILLAGDGVPQRPDRKAAPTGPAEPGRDDARSSSRRCGPRVTVSQDSYPRATHGSAPV